MITINNTPKLVKQAPETIYHYTSPDGILGIVQDDGIHLHFTRFDCVNDTSESHDVLDIYRKSCIELAEAGGVTPNTLSKILPLTPFKTSYFSFPGKDENGERLTKSLVYDTYICCFSEKEDSLAMWNYYHQGPQYSGYNLGFLSNMFDDRLFDNNADGFKDEPYGELHFYEVKYNVRQKIEYIKIRLEVIFGKYPTSKEQIREIRRLLRRLQYTFKNECFEHEKEFRAVMQIPHSIPNEFLVKEREVLFKSKNGLLIPYIEVVFKGKEGLHCATVGPLLEKELASRTLTNYFDSKKYNRIRILLSKIPIRF